MKKSGFTLIELLVGIAVVGILSTALLAVLNPLEQIKKGRDAQRKQDLAQIQRPLEVYYNDKGVYPSSIPFGGEWTEGGSQYMAKVPQDPLNSTNPTQTYEYRTEEGGYRLFAKLERCSDNQVIAGIDCNDPTITYNYSITSPNLSVGGPTPTLSLPSGTPIPTVSTPTPTPVVACADGTNDQIYSSSMVGCNGSVTYSQAATLCASGSHLCSVEEYFVNGGRTISSSVQRTLSTRLSGFQSCSSSLCGSSICGLNKPGDSGNHLATYQNKSAYANSCSVIDDSNVGYLIDVAITNGTNGAMCCSGAPIPTSTPTPTVSVPTPTTSVPTPTSTVSTPTPTPISSAKRVFVTSTKYSGNLGGLSGADDKCRQRAAAVPLVGTWIAWLSDSTTDAKNRITLTTGDYVRRDGVVIANGWRDLLDGSIDVPLNRDEFNNQITTTPTVWTATNSDGTKYLNLGNPPCQDWTSTSGEFGLTGNPTTTANWTNSGSVGTCSSSVSLQKRLYCFDQ